MGFQLGLYLPEPMSSNRLYRQILQKIQIQNISNMNMPIMTTNTELPQQKKRNKKIPDIYIQFALIKHSGQIMNSSVSQLEEANRFKKHLEQYWSSKGITQIKVPQIGGKELNLYKLYKSVCKKGGGQAVSNNKMWKEIVDQFGLPSTCTSASFTLKNHYQKYLLGYQQRYYFGKDDNIDLPELVAGRTRKPMTGIRGMQDGQPPINYLNKYGGQRAADPSSLVNELEKQYDKCDRNQIVTYLKRTKMYPSMPEVKRMILGFQSRLKQELNFAINTLMLYSVNTEAPFLFMQYPNVIESIYGFIKWIYPPQNITQIETLRTIMLTLRNLAIDYRNLQPIQQCGFVTLLQQIFQKNIDRQINRNIVDIFSSLTNIGLDCSKIVEHIAKYLDRDRIDDLETGIDLLKTLVQEKQEICQEIIINKLDLFSRLLIHQESFIREAVLEIFAFITDKSEGTRHACIDNFKFMNRVFALLSYNSESCEKQLQLAGYVLSNLAKDEKNLDKLRVFQKKLAIISFNDDSVSSITTTLLCRLTQPQRYKIQEEKQRQASSQCPN